MMFMNSLKSLFGGQKPNRISCSRFLPIRRLRTLHFSTWTLDSEIQGTFWYQILPLIPPSFRSKSISSTKIATAQGLSEQNKCTRTAHYADKSKIENSHDTRPTSAEQKNDSTYDNSRQITAPS